MEWIDKLNGNVIVCDAEGTVIYMNETAIRNYAKDGGAALIGRNLKDCHRPESNEKIRRIMETGKNNVYTIEKNGIKKIVYQSPWYDEAKIKGIVEFSLEIPWDMPHFVRE